MARTQKRRNNSHSSGKNPGKKSTKTHSPSATLHEVLTSLNITFNSDLGVLNGEFTSTVPSVVAVENTRKLLLKLSDQLEIVSNHDDAILDDIKDILTAREKGELIEDDEDDEEEGTVERMDRENDVVVIDDDEVHVKQENATSDADLLLASRDADGDVEMPDTIDKSMDDDDDEEDDDKDVFTDATDSLKVGTSPEQKKRKLSTERIENDPNVRNPKSEFVTSQTLPAAAQALGLFSEEDGGGLHQDGEDFLKKKYAVASYPKTDLKDKLPGVIPDIDFSKSKPQNQVQFTTFQSWFENFYRPFTEDDLKFLKSKHNLTEALAKDQSYDPNLTPYLIPDLGPLYSEVWNEEENAGNYSPPPQAITKDAIMAKNSSTDINDDTLETDNVSCGPLVSRLLSAILRDDRDDSNGFNMADEDDETRSNVSATALPEQQGWKVSSVNADYSTLEDRLKRELSYMGIFGAPGDNKDEDGEGPEPNWLNPQDDEVSMELRALQNELKQAAKRNNKRKKILQPIVEMQLAWQDYNYILDDLEKQIDQSYLKRIKAPKNKKRKTGNPVPPSLQAQLNAQAAQQNAANSAVRALLEKRQKWIMKVGPLFGSDGADTEVMKRYPRDSVFDKENLDEDEDEEYDDGEDLVLQQQDH